MTLANQNYTFLRSHWNRRFPFHNNTYSTIMSGRRFELLMSYLHLNDSEKQPARGSPNFDCQYKLRPFLDMIINSFKAMYIPHKNICDREYEKGSYPIFQKF